MLTNDEYIFSFKTEFEDEEDKKIKNRINLILSTAYKCYKDNIDLWGKNDLK